LTPGTRLGPYEILSPLGAGGMGEVYRAKDTKLGREVAIKVLPEKFFEETESIARFEREAKSLAAVNHPHIAGLFSFEETSGRHLLVMELADGQTLAERLLRGPLAPDQLLKTAIEIASALDAAHRAGIVHRDLKPGNVMLTKSGVKLLDFGLAKAAASVVQPSDLTSQPTMLPRNLTEKGTILGTLQYMAPEQLEGKEADVRTDIFAFGAVLYEMASGRKAFEAKSQASLISAIMSSDPPSISAIRPVTPPALDRLVRTCLAKDPEERWQSAADVARELRWIGSGSSTTTEGERRPRRLAPFGWGIAGALAATLLLVAIGAVRGRQSAPAIQLSLLPPGEMARTPIRSFALSPDGRHVALVARGSAGTPLLFVRPLASLSARPLAGTENAMFPFWSPDGRSLGFFAEGKLKKIDAEGGPSIAIADAPAGRGGSWSRDGTILFAPEMTAPLQKVPASGGAAATATTFDEERGDFNHRFPFFLPDGKRFLFFATAAGSRSGIYAGSLDSRDVRLLVPGQSNGEWVEPGWLLFGRDGNLMAQPFDGRLRPQGEAVPIAEGVAFFRPFNSADFSTSQSGVLAYRLGTLPLARLVWRDRSGRELGNVGEPATYRAPHLSPDGTRLSVVKVDPRTENGDVWVYDLERSTASRLTREAWQLSNPVWSPDGKRIAFGCDKAGFMDLYEIPADGSGAEKLLAHTKDYKVPTDWSRDGTLLAFEATTAFTGWDVHLLSLGGSGPPRVFAGSRFFEGAAAFSPDGSWIAFVSDVSGRPEICLRPVLGEGERVVSTAGGNAPRWRADGRELFYVGGDNRMMSVPIEPGPAAKTGVPRPLFEVPDIAFGVGLAHYDVTPDGQRFILVTPVAAAARPSLTIATGWQPR
jgi:Tol biopolymer transport system component/tRNA A-37 threonylcarbamoyl transferase component Bud32